MHHIIRTKEKDEERVVVLYRHELEMKAKVFAHNQLNAACGCIRSLDGQISMHSFVLKTRRAVEDAFTYVVAQQLLSRGFSRVKRFSKPHGSGQEVLKSHGSGRVKRF